MITVSTSRRSRGGEYHLTSFAVRFIHDQAWSSAARTWGWRDTILVTAGVSDQLRAAMLTASVCCFRAVSCWRFLASSRSLAESVQLFLRSLLLTSVATFRARWTNSYCVST